MKSLAIVSQGKNTCLALQEQLKKLLGNRVKITGYYVDGNMADNISADVVVISGKHSFKEALPRINPKCPIILARRAINYHEVDQLFDLPANTDVLLVNDLLSSAQETISLLIALGIDHIKYHSYAPGMKNYPHLKIAITPGEVNLIPACVEQVIDIKSRVIDLTTLTEILQKLSILDNKANYLSANYLRDIIELIKKSKYSTNVSNKIKNQLQTIINTVHDGIIAVDNEKRISVFNPVAETLFGLKAVEAAGSTIAQLPGGKNLAFFNTLSCENETFVKINHHHVIVNAAKIHEEATELGTVYTFKDVSEIQRLEEELRRKLVSQLHVARYTFDHILGKSHIIAHTVELARKMAASTAPILILGESGTGKELLAQGIHNASPRKSGPFVAVNFAAMTENLLESELFGYEEGSFTGARKGGSAGLFEQAHKGTLFLDEVGDAPLPFQVKLLRVLQEKQVRRIGGSRIIPIDVRVITATNRDLKKLIANNTFRQDLYYRLNVLPIKMPSLKDRKADILLLAESFYNAHCRQQKNTIPADIYLGRIAAQFLSYDWPGNIRELQNAIEYLVTISPDRPPSPSMLSEELQSTHTSLNAPEHQNLEPMILNTIAKFNEQKTPVGRRSLAAALSLPESEVRKSLSHLQREGLIQINKGRRGLTVLKDGANL
ncbi:MAG: sigma 54-interacting transcriptional regulator [Veillonellales bacterium]